jgi:hypothetical protein
MAHVLLSAQRGELQHRLFSAATYSFLEVSCEVSAKIPLFLPLLPPHHTHFQCFRLLTGTSREGTTQVCITCRFVVFFPSSQSVYKIDGNQTQSAPNQPSRPSQGESNFGDSSGPLFSIYSKAAEEEDNKMVERWQKDADGILIFVSPRVAFRATLSINWNILDRSILCCRRCAPCRDRPGPEAKQSGYFCILPGEHLSGSCRPKLNTCFYPLPCR